MFFFPNISWVNVKIENEHKSAVKECVRVGFLKSVFFLNLESRKLKKKIFSVLEDSSK